MEELRTSLARLVEEHRFSGVVRVDRDGHTDVAMACGFADRAFRIPNTVGTQFGLASATKGLTALTVISLIDDGQLGLATTVRSLLGSDLPEIDAGVTVEHLLAHRSGIGDYVDEEGGFDPSGYVLTVPVHELATTEGYLPVLDGRATKFPPGARFSYCNSGYVVLALIAERVTGRAFHELVTERVCGPADMRHTAFLRSDELPGHAARGYLEPDGLRTNVLHLPVRGSGDGGLYSTVGDVHALWRALFDGRIVPPHRVEDVLKPRSDVPRESRRYGLGFWLHQSRPAAILEGYDAGVSFRSVHDPAGSVTWTVVSNSSQGAWPLVGHLAEVFDAEAQCTLDP